MSDDEPNADALNALCRKRDEMKRSLQAIETAIRALQGRGGAEIPRREQHATRLAWEVLKQNGPLGANWVADLVLQRGYQTNARRFAAVIYQRMKEAPAYFSRQGRLWVAVGEEPPFALSLEAIPTRR